MLQESSNHSEQTMLAKKEFSPPRVPICQSCRILRTFVEQQESQEGTYEPAGHISEHEASTERSLHNRADLLRLLSWIPQDKTSLFQPGSGDSARRLDQPQPTDASQVKRWIIKCEREHKINCTIDPKAQEYLRDLRVIDCESNTVVPAPTDCRYVALSYVWGQQRSASETLLDPPETIAHSIHFARELGYRYLWIDKYVSEECADRVSMLLLTLLLFFREVPKTYKDSVLIRWMRKTSIPRSHKWAKYMQQHRSHLLQQQEKIQPTDYLAFIRNPEAW